MRLRVKWVNFKQQTWEESVDPRNQKKKKKVSRFLSCPGTAVCGRNLHKKPMLGSRGVCQVSASPLTWWQSQERSGVFEGFCVSRPGASADCPQRLSCCHRKESENMPCLWLKSHNFTYSWGPACGTVSCDHLKASCMEIHKSLSSAYEREFGVGGGRVEVKVLVAQLCPTLWEPTRLLCPWNSPSKNSGVGSHSFLRGNLPNSGIKPRSPALQGNSLPSEPPGKP